MNKIIKNKNINNNINFTTGVKKYFVFFIVLYFILASGVQAVDLGTTGFIPGQIWYSKSSFIEGETVKIYTALWNDSASSLSAKVEFYDKNVILGSRDITIPATTLKEVYISWKVTSGDHSISAKIISPSINTGGKKQSIAVVNNITETDKRFIPVVINTIDGKPASSSDIVKNQIDKATSSIEGIVPDSVSTGVSENVGALDGFRVGTLAKITETKLEAKDKIAKLDSKNNIIIDKTSGRAVSTQKNVGVVDATEKPITYLKLIFFSVLSFVFGSKLVFYAIIILLVFLILRFIYRKIRNR